MSSIGTAPPRPYPAPSPHGNLQLTGLRGWVARRPLTGFLVIVLGLSWLLFCIPVLAFYGVIPGANLPVEVFALASTLLIMLPTALWVTSITDGRAGVRALFARVFRWRFGIGWWLVVLFGLPVIALVLGLIFGGSLHTADVGLVLIKQLGSIVLAVVVINLWEETVWAGFFQTRLEARFNFVVAAVSSRSSRAASAGGRARRAAPRRARRAPRRGVRRSRRVRAARSARPPARSPAAARRAAGRSPPPRRRCSSLELEVGVVRSRALAEQRDRVDVAPARRGRPASPARAARAAARGGRARPGRPAARGWSPAP